MIDEMTKDWQWLSFLAQYWPERTSARPSATTSGGGRSGSPRSSSCSSLVDSEQDRVAYENWKHRRLFAKIADAETMKKHVWSVTTRTRRPEEVRKMKPGFVRIVTAPFCSFGSNSVV